MVNIKLIRKWKDNPSLLEYVDIDYNPNKVQYDLGHAYIGNRRNKKSHCCLNVGKWCWTNFKNKPWNIILFVNKLLCKKNT